MSFGSGLTSDQFCASCVSEVSVFGCVVESVGVRGLVLDGDEFSAHILASTAAQFRAAGTNMDTIRVL